MNVMELDGWTVAVDGGEPVPAVVRVEQEVLYLRSEFAVLPDPHWSFTDSHGHVHRWTVTGKDDSPWRTGLPTLVEVEEPCDGACGDPEHTWTRYDCAQCGDRVEPGTMPDYEARTTGTPYPGMKTMSAKLKAWPFGSRSVNLNHKWSPAVLTDPEGKKIRAHVMLGDYRVTMGPRGSSSDRIQLHIRPEVTADV